MSQIHQVWGEGGPEPLFLLEVMMESADDHVLFGSRSLGKANGLAAQLSS